MAKQRTRTDTSETIDAKLKELGLGSPDPDVSNDESDQSESVFEEEEESKADSVPPNPLEEDDEEEKSNTVSSYTPPKNSLRSALFAEEIKPPKFIETKTLQPAAEARANIPNMDELAEAPAYVEPQRTLRKEKPVASPFVKKLGSALGKKIPGAERVRIHKRDPINGVPALIGEYGAEHLGNCSDLESFIFQYLKPKWGPGTYMLTGVTPVGDLLRAGEVHMAAPEAETSSSPVMDLLTKTLEQQERERKEREQNSMAAPVNPIGMLRELQEVNRDMAQQTAPKEDNSIATMMMAMMQMQAQQSQQTMQMLATIMQPKEDPTTKLLLQKLVEGASSAPMMAPPPPPPAPSPWEGLKEMVAAMAPIVATLAPLMLSKRDDTAELKELVKTTLSSMTSQTLSPRDVIALMSEMKSKGGDDGGFRQSIEQLGLLMTVTQNMKQATEPQQGGGATFWDALAAFASNRDLGAGIAATIRQQTEMRQQQALLQQKQALIREQRNALVAVKQASAGHTAPPIAATPPVHPQAAASQGGEVVPMRRPAAPPQPQTSNTVITTPPPAPTETSTTALSDVPPKPAPAIPELPAMTADHLNGLIAAADDAELLQKTMAMLVYFNEFEDWQSITQALLGLTQADQREQAVQIVHQLFSTFVQLQLLDAPTANRTIEAFARHFNTIRDKLQGFPLASGEQNPIEDALASSNDSEEEDEEEDEDDESELEEVTDEEEHEEPKPKDRKAARH